MEDFKNVLFDIFKKYNGKIDTFWRDYNFEVPHYKEVRFTENGLEIDALDKSKLTPEQWKLMNRVDKRKATIKWKNIRTNFQFVVEKNETFITITYEYYDSLIKRTTSDDLDIYLTKKDYE